MISTNKIKSRFLVTVFFVIVALTIPVVIYAGERVSCPCFTYDDVIQLTPVGEYVTREGVLEGQNNDTLYEVRREYRTWTDDAGSCDNEKLLGTGIVQDNDTGAVVYLCASKGFVDDVLMDDLTLAEVTYCIRLLKQQRNDDFSSFMSTLK